MQPVICSDLLVAPRTCTPSRSQLRHHPTGHARRLSRQQAAIDDVTALALNPHDSRFPHSVEIGLGPDPTRHDVLPIHFSSRVVTHFSSHFDLEFLFRRVLLILHFWPPRHGPGTIAGTVVAPAGTVGTAPEATDAGYPAAGSACKSATHLLLLAGHPAPLQPETDGAAIAAIPTRLDLAAPAATVAPTVDGRRIRVPPLLVVSATTGGVGLRRVAHVLSSRQACAVRPPSARPVRRCRPTAMHRR